MKLAKRSPEFWRIQCPHCMSIGTYRVMNPPDPDRIKHLHFPILKCQCRKWFSKITSEFAIFTVCERVADGEVTPLMRRQCVDVWLEEREPETGGGTCGTSSGGCG